MSQPLRVELRRMESRGEPLPLPEPQTAGAAGFDLRSDIDFTLAAGAFLRIPTGLAMAIPEGFEGQVRPRSGLAAKHGVTLLNSPGTIDSDYRGEIQVLLINHGRDPVVLKRGARIAQLVIAPVMRCELVEVAELPTSARGAGGFGSTGV